MLLSPRARVVVEKVAEPEATVTVPRSEPPLQVGTCGPSGFAVQRPRQRPLTVLARRDVGAVGNETGVNTGPAPPRQKSTPPGGPPVGAGLPVAISDTDCPAMAVL